MDRALKQRLVGACVLIALAVIILPMLLSGQVEPTQQAAPIELPTRPKALDFETRRFPIGTPVPDRPSVVPEQPPASLPMPETESLTAVETAPAGELAMAPPEPATVLVGPEAASVTGVEEEAGADPAALLQPASPGPVQVVTPVTEPVPLVTEAPTPPPEDPSEPVPQVPAGRYLVQVASFSSLANAERLSQQLRTMSLPLVTDEVEVDAGRLHRVRVGAFEDRAEAERVLQRLQKDLTGLSPRLVDLRPDEASPVTRPDDPLVRWVVQVGVFSSADNAQRLVFELRDAGFRASSAAVTQDGATRHRVLVGPELDREAALRLRDRLLQERGLKGMVQSAG